MALPRFLRNSSAAGFTLLEALAALALTGMLFAAGLPLFVQFTESWSAGTGRSMAADQWMRATARIGDDLAEAMPLKMARWGRKAVAFRGSRERVDFVRTTLGGEGDFRLQSVSFLIVRRGRASVAIVRIARPFSRAGFERPPSSSEGVTLLRLRQNVSLDYVNAKGKRQGSWNPKAGLPCDVELRFAAPPASATGLASLVFPIVAASP